MTVLGFSRLSAQSKAERKDFCVPPFSPLFCLRAGTVTGPSAKPTTEPLTLGNEAKHPEKNFKKRNSESKKKIHFCCIFYFRHGWSSVDVVIQWHNTTRLPVDVGCTCRGGPLIRRLIWWSVADSSGRHVDGMTRIRNAGPGAFSSSLHVLPNCKFFRFSVQIRVVLCYLSLLNFYVFRFLCYCTLY